MRLGVSLQDKHVLVVDDDVVMLRLVRESLRSLVGCEVDTTPNPEYAFELILKKQYDLFIFDLVMPGIDGNTLFGMITKVYQLLLPPEHRLPPLLLMSGNAAAPRAQELLRSPGVRGLLAKPFTIDRLVKTVESVWAPVL